MAAFLLGSVLSAIVRKSSRKRSVEKSLGSIGFKLDPNCVSESLEEEVLHWLRNSDELPWEESIEGRRVLQFGNMRYDYNLQCATHSPAAPAVPDILSKLLIETTIVSDVEKNNALQCIVNIYESGDSIPYHIDDENFGEVVIVYTFGETRPLMLRKRSEDDEMNITNGAKASGEGTSRAFWNIFIPKRSCYVLRGEVRYAWEHSVPVGKDVRVSITFRSILNNS